MSAAITAAVIAAGGAYYSANKQSKAAKEAAKPKQTTSSMTPWGPAAGGLQTVIDDSLAEYTRLRDSGTPPPMRGGYASSSVQGASPLMQQLAQSAADRAMGSQPLLDSASNTLQGIYGGSVHPLMQRAYESAQNYSNPNLDTYVQRNMAGSGSRASGMLENLLSNWGGDDVNNSDPFSVLYQSSQGSPRGQQSYQPREPARYQAQTLQSQGGTAQNSLNTAATGQATGAGMNSKWQPSNTVSQTGRIPTGSSDPRLGALWGDEMARLLGGQYQTGENPHWQEIEASVRRDAETTNAARQAQLGAQAGGLGRFGSGVYMQQAEDSEAANAQQLGDTLGGLRYQNYDAERNRMLEGLGLMNSRDAWYAGDQTQRQGIASASASASEAASTQREIAREQAMLQGLGLLGGFEQNHNQNLLAGLGQQSQLGLAGLNMQGQLGSQANSDMLSALGLAPGINDAYYSGYGVAGGLAGQANSANQQAAAARDAASAQNSNIDYQNAMAQWQHDQTAGWANIGNLYNIMAPLGAQYGTQTGTQPGQYQPTVNPYSAAATAALGAYMANQFQPGTNSNGQRAGNPGPGTEGSGQYW